jgi:hypothetical protein
LKQEVHVCVGGGTYPMCSRVPKTHLNLHVLNACCMKKLCETKRNSDHLLFNEKHLSCPLYLQVFLLKFLFSMRFDLVCKNFLKFFAAPSIACCMDCRHLKRHVTLQLVLTVGATSIYCPTVLHLEVWEALIVLNLYSDPPPA